MAKNRKDIEPYQISAKNWIDPKEFARSKGVAKSDSPSKRVATPKFSEYEKPTATLSPYNAGLKLSPAQQAELEKSLKNRKMLENVQSGLGAAEVLGAFPHPVTEGLGFGAGLLNAGLSSYLAGQDYSAGNYGGMAGNLLGAGLSGAGAAALAPKKVTDVVNTAAKSKNLKELGAYALGGVPPEKAVGRIGKGDLKAMRQVQEIRRKTPNEYDKYLQAALDEDIPDLHFEKAFGTTKNEAQQVIQNRAAERAAHAQLVAERQAQEAQRAADLQAANQGNIQTQAAEDIDVNDIDWSQFDESNDSMYDYVSDDPVNDLDLDSVANQYADANRMPSPPDTIYTDTSSGGYVEDANGVLRNNYGETVAEESARLDRQYAEYLADEQGYGNYYNLEQRPGVTSQLASGQFRDAKNQLGEVVQEVGANPSEAMREVKEAFTNSTGENKLKNKAIELLQDYPYYGGSNVMHTNPSEFLVNVGSKKGFAERVNRSIDTADQIPSGQVFTGSTSTSHNSYLPQLKKIFKEGVKEGDPTFLGYKDMNPFGYLSQGSYTPEEIAAYLNTEIDEQIKRKIVPKNIQRPYVKDNNVLLPHYGIKKKENGGWLQKYNDGGPVQPNYNDYSVSAGPDFEGDGYSNVGRNYSPAWGGQFEDGGKLKDNAERALALGSMAAPFPLSYGLSLAGSAIDLYDAYNAKTPHDRNVQLTEAALGAIPYGRIVKGMKIGSDFYKGYKALKPIAAINSVIDVKDTVDPNLKYAMGGSMPGAVGFMYARTNDPAPSEGKYAKKTLPSAQDGIVAKTDATRVAAPNLKLTKAQLDKNKAINKQVMANTEKANAIKLAERKKGMAESSDASVINPNGKRFAIGDKLRLFPNDIGGVGEMFDDFINPGVFVGDTASGLGNAMIDRDPKALATETGMALGAGALGFDPLGNTLNTKLKFKAPANLNLVKNSMNPLEGINNAYQNTRANIFRATNNANIQDAVQDYTHIADMRARRQALIDRIGAQQPAPGVTPHVSSTAAGNIFEEKGLNFLQNPMDPATGIGVNQSFVHPNQQNVQMVGNSGYNDMSIKISDPYNPAPNAKTGTLRATISHPGGPGFRSDWPQDMPAFTDFNFFNEGPGAGKQLQTLMQGIEGKPVYLPSPGSVSMHSQPLMTQTLARYASQKNAEGIARARIKPTLDYAGRVEMKPLNYFLRGTLDGMDPSEATRQLLEQFPKIQKSIGALNNVDRRLNLPDAKLMYNNQEVPLSHFEQNPFQSMEDYRNNFRIYHPQYSAIKRWREGGELTKLDQLTNFSNYNTPTKGGWLDKYN
jgi:hypothetical protein